MPQRARTVEIQAVPATVSHEEAVRRVARATDLLFRIAARLDAQKALAQDNGRPNALHDEKSDCPRGNEEQPPF